MNVSCFFPLSFVGFASFSSSLNEEDECPLIQVQSPLSLVLRLYRLILSNLMSPRVKLWTVLEGTTMKDGVRFLLIDAMVIMIITNHLLRKVYLSWQIDCSALFVYTLAGRHKAPITNDIYYTHYKWFVVFRYLSSFYSWRNWATRATNQRLTSLFVHLDKLNVASLVI